MHVVTTIKITITFTVILKHSRSRKKEISSHGHAGHYWRVVKLLKFYYCIDVWDSSSEKQIVILS